MPKQLYNEPSPLETKVVSKRFTLENSERLDTYLAKDGFKAFTKARQMTPEAIVEEELRRFLKEMARRSHGPVIARLTEDFEAKRQAIVRQLMQRLDGRLAEADRAYIEGAFRLLQNQFLHGPISALAEETHEGGRHTLLDALRKLFRLGE